MDKILDNYGKKPKVQAIKGDFIDRLHGNITVTFLFVILILIILRQAIYSNIQCWYPTSFSDPQGEYLLQFCWINSTYNFPEGYDSKEYDAYHHQKDSIPYYQFITFILLGQIFMFYLPTKIWKILSSNINGYINKLLQISSATFIISDNDRNEFLKTFKPIRTKSRKYTDSEESSESASFTNDNNLDTIDEESVSEMKNENLKVSQRQKSFKSQTSKTLKTTQSSIDHSIKQKLFTALGPLKGIKGLTIKYFLLKILNLANVIGQIFLLNLIFGGKFLKYGYKYAIKLFYAENPLLMTKEFPIFTLCDFYVHQANRKIHENTVQCILTVNVLLEKFYVFIWFWLIFLGLITIWNFFSWFYEIIFASNAQFLYKYLNIQFNMNLNHNEEHSRQQFNSRPNDDNIKKFQNDYLGKDGLCMLLIIKSVAGDIAFIDLLDVLWKDFTNEDFEKKTNV